MKKIPQNMPEGLSEATLVRARKKIAEGVGISYALKPIEFDSAGKTRATISVKSLVEAGSELSHALSGVGRHIRPLLQEEGVTDVLINGHTGVWVDRGCGLERHHELSQIYSNDHDVRILAVQMAAACGQRLDDQSPIVDGTFPGGVRLHALLPPLSQEGPLISLRNQRPQGFSLEQLRERKMLDDFSYALLIRCINKRVNVMISGATGSGKTTLLAAILSQVSARERILIIEESAELLPHHPHIVHLQVRKANVQGRGEITMSDLVRAAMRMRPDRIVLGECRGGEVREVLSALNTGHEGGWATIHANSAVDVPSRLVALGALAGMGESVLAAQAASGLDAIMHVERLPTGRALTQVACVERRNGELIAIPALSRVYETHTYNDYVWKKGPGWSKLCARLSWEEENRATEHKRKENEYIRVHGAHEESVCDRSTPEGVITRRRRRIS